MSMIPRLPPLLLALIGGASVYGIKVILDRLEPMAIGPPGSSEHAEKLNKIKIFARRGGIAMAAAGTIYAGAWAYGKRTHRPTPAASHTDGNEEGFYSDQYSDREQRFRAETEKLKQEQQQKEQHARSRLAAEQASMENRTSSSSPSSSPQQQG
ncbi:hypothetical protein BDB00DRAFT_489179 [Zychaea mexicana]|uniref:uncharacterized protein n=1 Tax=Zychaea mexicana TaxID=64656 RepID=UPI0022FEF776|nr:uncharacterized protein BDB00DRAFT_489179 [Zychaea mexicana]KAI9491401.1 hypothetical protein BDB00DRAFT_489179 [Zychaea mexicana]